MLEPCRACGRNISDRALACPKCGEPRRVDSPLDSMERTGTTIALGFEVAVLLSGVVILAQAWRYTRADATRPADAIAPTVLVALFATGYSLLVLARWFPSWCDCRPAWLARVPLIGRARPHAVFAALLNCVFTDVSTETAWDLRAKRWLVRACLWSLFVGMPYGALAGYVFTRMYRHEHDHLFDAIYGGLIGAAITPFLVALVDVCRRSARREDPRTSEPLIVSTKGHDTTS